MELQRGSILGSYELLTRIGRGGMASVWVARGRRAPGEPERIFAVKAMLPNLAENMEFRTMFLDEGQIVRSIDHPNVVRVYDVDETDGVLFMAMEWVEGDSLHTIIAEANKRRPIPPELAVRMIADTAAGLHAAHELRGWDGELRNIVHCDVSPHNILIGLDGAVKLVDFGVASAMGQITDEEDVKIRGKFGYMSPEQAQAKPIDRRSDVFSLGIVLFELTTGYRLFRGRDDKHTLDLVSWGKIPRPSEVIPSYPKKLEAIVMRALERKVEDRFQTAEELRDTLETYLVEERIVIPSAGIRGLLKRVLGQRLEQRREAIREAVRALDGQRVVVDLVSDEAILSADEDVELLEEGSDVVRQSEVSSSTGLGAARLPSDTSSGPQTMSQPSAAPAPTRNLLPALVAVALVSAVAGGGLLWLLQQRNAQPQVQEYGSAKQGEAVPTAPPGASPSQPASKHGNALPTDLVDLDELPRVGSPPPGPGARRGSSTTTAPPPSGDRDRLQRDMQHLLTPEGPAPTPAPPEPAPTPTKPAAVQLEESSSGGMDRAAVSAALSTAANFAQSCRIPGEQTGKGRVLVTVSPSGSIDNVQVQPPFAGTAVGGCVASKFRAAKVPSYSGTSVVVGKSFTIPD